MPARVPLDVDLEDRLVFGLNPIRFGYLAIAALAAFATWSSAWLPLPVRLPLAGLLGLAGAALAWGSHLGRGADQWAADMVRFGLANYRLELVWRWRPRRPQPILRVLDGCESCSVPGLESW